MRMPAQQAALKLTIERFEDDSGRFDRGLWRNAFESNEPEAIAHVWEVTGGYQALVNHLIEMLQVGARLAGLPVSKGGRPVVPDLVGAIRDDGGFSRNRADVLIELYRLRNGLQHQSPDILADDVHDEIETLLKTLPGLLKAFVAWLESRGVELLPRG
jgi:hypothetical protein